MIAERQAQSFNTILNAAIAQSGGEAYDLALILLVASARIATHASAFYARAYARSLRLCAASLDREKQ